MSTPSPVTTRDQTPPKTRSPRKIRSNGVVSRDGLSRKSDDSSTHDPRNDKKRNI